MKFLLSFCQLAHHDTTNKWRNEILVCGSVVFLVRCTSRRNDEMEFHFVVVRFVAFSESRRNDKTIKLLQHIKVWFVVVTYSFCRLFVLMTSTGTKTREWRRNKMRYCGHFVLSFVRLIVLWRAPKRANDMTVSGFYNLAIQMTESCRWYF